MVLYVIKTSATEIYSGTDALLLPPTAEELSKLYTWTKADSTTYTFNFNMSTIYTKMRKEQTTLVSLSPQIEGVTTKGLLASEAFAITVGGRVADVDLDKLTPKMNSIFNAISSGNDIINIV